MENIDAKKKAFPKIRGATGITESQIEKLSSIIPDYWGKSKRNLNKIQKENSIATFLAYKFII